jgi:CheY-like chemotaxis protein
MGLRASDFESRPEFAATRRPAGNCQRMLAHLLVIGDMADGGRRIDRLSPFRQWCRNMLPTHPNAALRILIVEDLHDSADSMAILLRLWGHEVAIAYDGPHALRAAALKPPEVVLLDIGLPGMDGLQVARQLRLLPGMGQALLIAVTGYGWPDVVERCKEAGIDRYFLKPVEPELLRSVLNEHPRPLNGELRQVSY